MGSGAWLMAHTPRPVAQGSWLLAKETICRFPQAPRHRAKFFLSIIDEPWATSFEAWGMSLEPWAVSHEPLTIDNQSVRRSIIM